MLCNLSWNFSQFLFSCWHNLSSLDKNTSTTATWQDEDVIILDVTMVSFIWLLRYASFPKEGAQCHFYDLNINIPFDCCHTTYIFPLELTSSMTAINYISYTCLSISNNGTRFSAHLFIHMYSHKKRTNFFVFLPPNGYVKILSCLWGFFLFGFGTCWIKKSIWWNIFGSALIIPIKPNRFYLRLWHVLMTRNLERFQPFFEVVLPCGIA